MEKNVKQLFNDDILDELEESKDKYLFRFEDVSLPFSVFLIISEGKYANHPEKLQELINKKLISNVEWSKDKTYLKNFDISDELKLFEYVLYDIGYNKNLKDIIKVLKHQSDGDNDIWSFQTIKPMTWQQLLDELNESVYINDQDADYWLSDSYITILE